MRPFLSFPFFFLAAVVFAGLLILLFILVQLGLFSVAFVKLGFTPGEVFLVLLATLVGSGVNLPLMTLARPSGKAPGPVRAYGPLWGPVWRQGHRARGRAKPSQQLVAVNVGGCLVPLVLSVLFMSRAGVSTGLVLALAATIVICHVLSRPVAGLGIAVPVLLPPIAAALAAVLLGPPEWQPQTAYVAGTLGTLIGADILHMIRPGTRRILDAPVLSVGGAGTFDGIFLTGIIAVLLA